MPEFFPPINWVALPEDVKAAILNLLPHSPKQKAESDVNVTAANLAPMETSTSTNPVSNFFNTEMNKYQAAEENTPWYSFGEVKYPQGVNPPPNEIANKVTDALSNAGKTVKNFFTNLFNDIKLFFIILGIVVLIVLIIIVVIKVI